MRSARRVPTGNIGGMLWMTLGAACVVVMSALLKHLTQDLPVAVVLFFRMAFAVPLVLPWMLRDGARSLATRRLGGHLLRGTVGALSMWCWVFAVKSLSLATFTAISFTRPLWMSLTAWCMLGEVVGWRRFFLIMLGFAGVLVAAGPEFGVDRAMTTAATTAVLVAVLGGALSSLTLLLVKQLSSTESSAQIVFYFSLCGTAYVLPFAIVDWATPSAAQYAWLALSAAAAAGAQYCVARAVAIGEATAITPVDFLQLPLAALAGFVVFDETPGLATVLGAAVILAATLAIARQGRRDLPPAERSAS